MITIENFGLYNKENQEELFSTLLSDGYKYISYYAYPFWREVDDDTLELLCKGLIHFYNPRVKELVESTVIHHIFIHCYNKNEFKPMRIMADLERNINLFETGNLELMDSSLKNDIKKAISLCLWLNVDYNEYEELKSRSVEFNHKYYSNGSLHYCECEVMWFSLKSVHELVLKLSKYGRFEFLMINNSIENYLLGFEIYENTESFDLMIYNNDKEENYCKKIMELGFDVK